MKDAALGFREEAGAGGHAELAGVPLDDGTCCGLGGVVDPSGQCGVSHHTWNIVIWTDTLD